MCKAFSCIVLREGKCLWEAGIDSHDELVDKYKIKDDTIDLSKIGFARIEIIPANKRKYPYLWPELKWRLIIDERVRPEWLSQEHEMAAWDAHKAWRDTIYQFNYQEARRPVNPFKIKAHTVSGVDIDNLKKWYSVRASVVDSVVDSVGDSVVDSVGDSVRASVWDSVWDSVGDSVGDSVWAYIGSLFPNIKTWKYIEHKEGEYPFQSAADLWARGLVPSFDTKVWRLHSGEKAKIVYELKVVK